MFWGNVTIIFVVVLVVVMLDVGTVTAIVVVVLVIVMLDVGTVTAIVVVMIDAYTFESCSVSGGNVRFKIL